MKKIFFLLFIFLFLFSCNEKSVDVNYEIQYNSDGSIILTDEFTIPGDTFYFLTLTTEESNKNKKYTKDDFNYDKLEKVEEFIEPSSFNDIYYKNYYHKILRLLFKNLNDNEKIDLSKKFSEDERIISYKRNDKFELAEDPINVYTSSLESNLNINKITCIYSGERQISKTSIINNLDSLNELKNACELVKDEETNHNAIHYLGDILFMPYDENYFINKSLIFLCINRHVAYDMIFNSINLDNNKYEINTTSYFNNIGSDETIYNVYFLIEINSKIENKEFVFNNEKHKSYYYDDEILKK